MFEYPDEIFGAKKREEKFGVGEEQYVLHCYDIFGGTYSVRVDGYFISSRFDYGEIHSSSFRSRDGFEGFERNAAKLVNKVIAYFLKNDHGKDDLIRMENPGKKIAEHVEKDLKSRFCHCCFFGHVEGELMGEPLCKECAKILYGFDADEERPSIKKIDPYYQLWYRRRKTLPIFEAYLHSEIERYKLEQKLEDAKATAYAESVDAGMENRRLKRALWLARTEMARTSAWVFWDRKDDYNYNKWKNVERKCLKKAKEYK